MFSTKKQLEKRTPDNGTDREQFLSLLVDEYLNSSYDGKSQVLANLANFAYDPINYGYIRDVGVLDIFLHVIKNESDLKLLNFATAGICNLCLDPSNIEYLLGHGIIEILNKLLKCEEDDIIASVITILIQLHICNRNLDITNYEIMAILKNLRKSGNIIIVNLATIFLENVESTN